MYRPGGRRPLHGHRFLVRLDGRLVATPLLLALIAIELSDIVFAIDSVPAAFAVTEEPFLIYSANLFAILGLRALYVVLAGAIADLRYLRFGLAAVLAFAGGKLLTTQWLKIPPLVSVAVAFPMCRSLPCLPVTYQPPQRSDNGLSWLVTKVPSLRMGWPSSAGYTERTSMPFTPLVRELSWQLRQVSFAASSGFSPSP